MKRIFINDYFLKSEDLDFEVIRVKALLVNSKGELLLAHNNNTYQLIGGHKEDDETLVRLKESGDGQFLVVLEKKLKKAGVHV